MDNLKILIIDDEAEACDNLTRILFGYKNLHIAGVAHSTTDAEKQINACRPAAVFLDIEMPGENAFQFLERIAPFDFEVIFVTAYDDYAVKAFKLNAIDYILKPIDEVDVLTSVDKLLERVAFIKLMNHPHITYSDLSTQVIGKQKQYQIILRNNNHYEVVAFKDIQYVEAVGRYSNIYFLKNGGIRSILMSHSIAEYEVMLPEDFFFRIHRSFLVNCARIERVLKNAGENMIVINEIQLPVSRRRYTDMVQFLKSGKFYGE